MEAAVAMDSNQSDGEFETVKRRTERTMQDGNNGRGNVTAKVDGGHLVLSIPLQRAQRSKSGKTLIVATTHGILETDAHIDGKPVAVGLNAFIKA